MLQRRTLALFLIIGGCLALVLILVWVFWPWLTRPQPTRTVVPIPVTTEQPYYPTLTPPTPEAPTSSVPLDPNSDQEKERQAEHALERFAKAWTDEAGTYANADGFFGLRRAYVQSSPEVQAYLEKQRLELAAAHGQVDKPWARTSRALAARITSGLPLMQRASAEVAVQSLVESEQAGTSTRGFIETRLQVERHGETWMVTHVASKPFAP